MSPAGRAFSRWPIGLARQKPTLLRALSSAWYVRIYAPQFQHPDRDIGISLLHIGTDGLVTQVGSKIDRIGSRTVKREEGEALAKKYGATFYECSSKTRENIREPFVTTVDRIVDTPQLMDPALLGRRDGTVALKPRTDEEIASGCSC